MALVEAPTMARISILLTETMIKSLERIQRVQPLSTRASVMSTALEAGLLALSSTMATPTVTSKAKRRTSKEPAERLDQALDARDHGVGDAPDMRAFNPAVTAVTVLTATAGSADPDDPEAYFEKLSSSPGGIAANPFE